MNILINEESLQTFSLRYRARDVLFYLQQNKGNSNQNH